MEETIDQIPKGTFRASIDKTFKNYKIFAYPSNEIIKQGRAEHLPYHCHIYQNGLEWRISISEKIEELDGKKIPKDLKNYLIQNKDGIRKKIIEVFHTGKLQED